MCIRDRNIQKILQLGPSFALKACKAPIKRVITDVEYVLRKSRTSEQKKGEVRHNVINMLKFEKGHPEKRSSIERELFNDVKDTKKFLKNNCDILPIVLEADKGRATVLMSKDTYMEKMKKMLQENSDYERVKDDPTNKLQIESNTWIDGLKKKKWIDGSFADFMKRHDAVGPKIYGLPKIHKANYPLRPIVSTKKSLTENLCKFMAGILNCL